MVRSVVMAFLSVATAVAAAAPVKTKGPAAPPAATATATPVTLAPAELKAFKARSIGPATMSGRVSEIALDSKDPFTFYVGLGTGGLMKTVDNGASFKAVFKEQPVASIG